MDSLFSNPLELAFALIVSILAARKAARLMGVSNQSTATLFAAVLALFGPLLIGKLIALTMPEASEQLATLAELVGDDVGDFGSRTGLALVGVMAWSGFEPGR